MEIGGGRRLAVSRDGLCVESRSGGTWTRARVIPYDDVRALYRYQTTDWGSLVLLGGLWVVLLLVLLVAAAVARWSAGLSIGSAAALTVLFVVLGIVRGRNVPLRLLRIEAYSGALQVPERSPAFFASLAAQVHPAASPAPEAPSPAPAVEPPPVPVDLPDESRNH
jgi:hypothetical protein